MTRNNSQLGFIGLGAMGGPMAINLLQAGYPLIGYDLDNAALARCVAAGARAAREPSQLVDQADIILTSLPSSAVFVSVAETTLLPHIRAGQILIDLGTTEGREIRRLAATFADKGATLIDAPLSGGEGGAKAGNLRIFVGGDEAVVNQCRPILEVIGDPERVVYCGQSGSGQTVKGVNQLAMGLGAAAYLEAVAYGVRVGVDPAAIEQAVGGETGWRNDIVNITKRIMADSAEGIVVKFPELPYFLNEANAQNIPLPLTTALFEFLDSEPRNWRDNMQRPTVSFWHTLLNRKPKTK